MCVWVNVRPDFDTRSESYPKIIMMANIGGRLRFCSTSKPGLVSMEVPTRRLLL